MKPKTEMLIASAFSFTVGLGAGLYALWPQSTEPVSATSQPTHDAPTASADSAPPLNPEACRSTTAVNGPYEYTSDWVNTEDRLDAWNRYLKPLADKPVNYLEVGVYEGRSMIWMLENVLKHPDSRAAGIDLALYNRYVRNLVRSGACQKVRNLIGRSQDLLHTLPKASFDLIYIDGSHLGQDVLVDAVLAFDLLKVSGLMIFDDYKWYTNWASDIRPGVAIDAFVTEYRHQLEFVHRGYQVIVRKKEHPCNFNKFRFTPVGPYCYQWVTGELVRQSDRKLVKLMPGERDLIAEIASSVEFGEIHYPLERFKSRSEFRAMNKRLGIFQE